MKKYCTQLGMSALATDDNVNSNASIHIVSEEVLADPSRTGDRDLRHSLLSTDNLRKPIIVICATRESATSLRSGPLGFSLPNSTQFLWLPIGPTKLAGVLSNHCTYCAVGTLRADLLNLCLRI